jgi:hypothetical protein
MNILIESVDHDKQRYPTVGDWEIDSEKNTIHIKVSRTGNWRYELLIGVHELLEVVLCLDRGITGAIVDKFDTEYERRRKDGDDSEPGDDPHAPYRREHFFATTVERLLAAELGVTWHDYENALNKL